MNIKGAPVDGEPASVPVPVVLVKWKFHKGVPAQGSVLLPSFVTPLPIPTGATVGLVLLDGTTSPYDPGIEQVSP